MEKKDLEINNLIMQEIGLEIGIGNKIIDQDTGTALAFRGMPVIAPGTYGHNSIEFDPYNNKKMMSNLFGYFLDKHSEESDVDVLAYYNIDHGNKSSIECKLSDQSRIVSKPYVRDSLKYADIIIQLNGGEAPNLDEYDTETKSTVRKKRSSNATKNKSNTKTAKHS